MIVNRAKVPKPLSAILEPDLPCFQREVFLHSLDVELARARRYHLALCVLLFEVRGEVEADRQCAFTDFIHLVNRHLRQGDFVGRMGEAGGGIFLFQAGAESAHKIAQRLQSEFSMYFSTRHPCLDLRVSYGAFPTEAKTPDSLLALAKRRLR